MFFYRLWFRGGLLIDIIVIVIAICILCMQIYMQNCFIMTNIKQNYKTKQKKI